VTEFKRKVKNNADEITSLNTEIGEIDSYITKYKASKAKLSNNVDKIAQQEKIDELEARKKTKNASLATLKQNKIKYEKGVTDSEAAVKTKAAAFAQ
jgi:chromosome segregation ATPase